MPERILAIDDEYLVLQHIQGILESANYEVSLVTDSKTSLQQYYKTEPNLIILDLVMPELSGFEVCSQLREVSPVPIIILSALDDEDNIVKGLECGADDYVTKPLRKREMLARVHATLRRARTVIPVSDNGTHRFGPNDELIIDCANRQVLAFGEVVDLTRTEYGLLVYMAERANRILPSKTILNQVWPDNTTAGEDSVKWYVWRLRSKIEKDARSPQFIFTERGIGYRFAPTFDI